MQRDWIDEPEESGRERTERIDAMLENMVNNMDYGQRMSIDQIAARCGCSKRVIAKIEERALRKLMKLRKELQE